MMYAVVSTDRLETMLFVSDDKWEVADYLHLSIEGVNSAIKRSRHKMKAAKPWRIVTIPEEDIDEEASVSEG